MATPGPCSPSSTANNPFSHVAAGVVAVPYCAHTQSVFGSRLSRGLIAAIAILLCVFVARRWFEQPDPPPMPKPALSGYAPVNGIRMYYASYGSGAPILMIHGGMASGDIWANQIAPLVAAGHRVIVADSRGQGRSTRDAAPLGYDLMAADYVALLDYLKLKKVALVGWSDGGIIGLDIAMRHPERLSRLFAQAANATVDGIASEDDVWTFSDFARQLHNEIRHWFSGPDPNEELEAEINRMWETEPNWTQDQLRSIAVPTAIVLGDHDTSITLEHTEYMAQTIPGARLIILPGAGHVAMLDNPKRYTSAILTFIDGK